MSASIETPFATALLDANRAIPPGVVSHTAEVPTKRFAVYRNNVVASLVAALKVRFPAVMRIVGEEFFAAMARVFVTTHPPRSPILMFYGDTFADFIEGFAPASDLPYLADVARLEAARTHAYHAADAPPLDPMEIKSIEESGLGSLRIARHPSAQIVRSRFPIVTIWAMNAGEMELQPIADWSGEDALVVRPYLEVEVRKLPPGGAAFLAALYAGHPLASAIEAAQADSVEFDLVANLAGLISSGAATTMSCPAGSKDTSS